MPKGTETVDDRSPDNIAALDDDKETPEDKKTWKYSSEDDEDSSRSKVDASLEDINWSASEYIAHDKSIVWYLALIGITIIVSAGVYLLTHDVLSTLVIALAGGVMGFYAWRKPRLLNYKINSSGLTVQDKLFGYDSFKSFAINEGTMPNIILMPLKRFMPSLTIYLDPSSAEEVVKVLSASLPQHIHRADIVDRFFERIRF